MATTDDAANQHLLLEQLRELHAKIDRVGKGYVRSEPRKRSLDPVLDRPAEPGRDGLAGLAR